MSIWFDEFPLAFANEHSHSCLIENLGIELLEAGDDYLKGCMPVDHRTRQPAGILHGGASVAFAETLASWAAMFTLDRSKFSCVGLEINANHLRQVRSGLVYGIAHPVHLGKRIQVWEVRITNEKNQQVCVSRVTMAVLTRISHQAD